VVGTVERRSVGGAAGETATGSDVSNPRGSWSDGGIEAGGDVVAPKMSSSGEDTLMSDRNRGDGVGAGESVSWTGEGVDTDEGDAADDVAVCDCNGLQKIRFSCKKKKKIRNLYSVVIFSSVKESRPDEQRALTCSRVRSHCDVLGV
jgi:hypothetical protein